MEKMWTLEADLSVGDLQTLAIEHLGYDPGCRAGHWSAASAGGGEKPPAWMTAVAESLRRDGIHVDVSSVGGPQ